MCERERENERKREGREERGEREREGGGGDSIPEEEKAGCVCLRRQHMCVFANEVLVMLQITIGVCSDQTELRYTASNSSQGNWQKVSDRKN